MYYIIYVLYVHYIFMGMYIYIYLMCIYILYTYCMKHSPLCATYALMLPWTHPLPLRSASRSHVCCWSVWSSTGQRPSILDLPRAALADGERISVIRACIPVHVTCRNAGPENWLMLEIPEPWMSLANIWFLHVSATFLVVRKTNTSPKELGSDFHVSTAAWTEGHIPGDFWSPSLSWSRMAAISSGNLCYKIIWAFPLWDPQSSPWEEPKKNGWYLRKPSKSKEFGGCPTIGYIFQPKSCSRLSSFSE